MVRHARTEIFDFVLRTFVLLGFYRPARSRRTAGSVKSAGLPEAELPESDSLSAKKSQRRSKTKRKGMTDPEKGAVMPCFYQKIINLCISFSAFYRGSRQMEGIIVKSYSVIGVRIGVVHRSKIPFSDLIRDRKEKVLSGSCGMS